MALQPQNRPFGVTAIATLCVLLGLASLGFAGLLLTGRVPLSAGGALIGGGFEQLGPIAFVLYAAILFLLALGLARGRNWGRRLTLLFAVAGIALVVPAISSAVMDSRLFAIAREGAQIIVRVVVVFYLSQEPVREWFLERLTQ